MRERTRLRKEQRKAQKAAAKLIPVEQLNNEEARAMRHYGYLFKGFIAIIAFSAIALAVAHVNNPPALNPVAFNSVSPTTASSTQSAVSGEGMMLYYVRDHLGSVTHLIDENGQVRAEYEYDPYGRRTKIRGDLDTDIGYAGMFYHEKSGLYLTQHRAYDPKLGRWLSRDPIGEHDGTNLYAYVGNNPINKVDPKGLSAEAPFGYVCCRAIDTTGAGALERILSAPFKHCHISSGACNSGEESYPITHDKSESRYIDKGGKNNCPCSKTSQADVQDCMKRHPYSAGSGTYGSNCQSSVLNTLNSCCLKSSWNPNFYAGPSTFPPNPTAPKPAPHPAPNPR